MHPGVALDRNGLAAAGDRRRLELVVRADLRELTAQTDWTARVFAQRVGLSSNEFRALVLVASPEPTEGRMTATVLRKRMGLSAAAITSLVQRLTDGGYLSRGSHPEDRRLVILLPSEHGTDTVRAFFAGVARGNRGAMADLSDADLAAAHRAFGAMVTAMRGFRAGW